MSTFVGLTCFISSALITMLSRVIFHAKSIAPKKIQTGESQRHSVLKVVGSSQEQSSTTPNSFSDTSSSSSTSYVSVLQLMERIKIGRNLISIFDFIRIGRETLSLFQTCEWRYVMFDKMLTAALTYFGESKVEYIVLETGIGGRFDSTNFFDHPAACVITSISLDHQALLGNTLEEIAWQKAGIIKPGADVFTVANQQESVIRIFRQECVKKNAKLHIVDANRAELGDLALPIHYRVQLENACLSSAVLQHLGISREGMNSFYWPCRMEAFQLPYDKLVVLDGCHNEDSVIQFLSGLKERYPTRKVLSLFGAGDEKCVSTMLAQVMERSHSVIFLRSKHVRAVPASSLWDMLSTYSEEIKQKVVHTSIGLDVREQTIDEKISFVLEYLDKIGGAEEYVIAVFGSLFVASEAREVLYRIEPSLFGPNDWVREADPTSL
eukprot:gene25195-33719_t